MENTVTAKLAHPLIHRSHLFTGEGVEGWRGGGAEMLDMYFLFFLPVY